MKIMQPLVSIIIVNWNGRKWLDVCLKSLFSQKYKNFEVIFVDNASKDDSVSFVKANFPSIRIIESQENLGFAGGNNLGLQHAQGEYIYLLNSDTESTENSLIELVEYMETHHDVAITQPQLLLLGDRLYHDSVIAYWTYTTMLFYDGAYAKVNDVRYAQELKTYTIKGAAGLIRRAVIDKIGLFDDTYWCYFEETDFCHRAWLAGYSVTYSNTAPVYHAGGGASLQFENSFVQFHNFKNKLHTYLKNFELMTLLYVIPIHVMLLIFLSIFYLIKDYKKSIALIRSLVWNIQYLPRTLRQRKIVQSYRTKSDNEYMSSITNNPPIRYYYHLLTNLKKYAEIR